MIDRIFTTTTSPKLNGEFLIFDYENIEIFLKTLQQQIDKIFQTNLNCEQKVRVLESYAKLLNDIFWEINEKKLKFQDYQIDQLIGILKNIILLFEKQNIDKIQLDQVKIFLAKKIN